MSESLPDVEEIAGWTEDRLDKMSDYYGDDALDLLLAGRVDEALEHAKIWDLIRDEFNRR